MLFILILCYFLFMGVIGAIIFAIAFVINLFRIGKMSREIYPGIDAIMEGIQEEIEYDCFEQEKTQDSTREQIQANPSLKQVDINDRLCCFYDKHNRLIAADEFVRVYSESYYLGEERLVAGVQQNSRYVENEIDRLLCEGIRTEEDVFRILAWKTGAIQHAKSEQERKFVYNSGTNVTEKILRPPLRQEIYVKQFVRFITNNIAELERMVASDPQRTMDYLKSYAPKGIGTVYLITMLYFITRGRWPIYDKFAMIAIDAIIQGKRPGEEVTYRELPTRDSRGFGQIINSYREKYIRKLETVFGKEYYRNRDVDRALWVYGHSFTLSK